jgi:hypothetical protein
MDDRSGPKPRQVQGRDERKTPASDVVVKRGESGLVDSLVRRRESASSLSATCVAGQGIDELRSRLAEMRRLYAAGDVDAALDIASLIRPAAPAFSLAAVPKVVMSAPEILKLPLDHRAGFLLGRIDGRTDLRGVLDIAAMPANEAAAILEQLLSLGAIRLLPPSTLTDVPTPTSPFTDTPSPSPPLAF